MLKPSTWRFQHGSIEIEKLLILEHGGPIFKTAASPVQLDIIKKCFFQFSNFKIWSPMSRLAFWDTERGRKPTPVLGYIVPLNLWFLPIINPASSTWGAKILVLENYIQTQKYLNRSVDFKPEVRIRANFKFKILSSKMVKIIPDTLIFWAVYAKGKLKVGFKDTEKVETWH